ncbi:MULTISPECIES: exosortase/archaeosortase family protein [Marinobacter]|jgi:exosortase|uniref:exosortase/archaeosortase family protein n=1 Tax=Marinobacter TaxID=2742 RepID=UPI000FCB295B|nr:MULTISPECIES: exosortase/archaeosortase family protein [Marinobacter]MCC4282370.1 exosortase [Marinobacter salarius]MDM8180469.1 exosortase/archaeosortase family protein [Marinobacter salarius]RUT74884.1 exosortase/archaeosortase family protein [Marinobacter sp. NP-6]HIO03332.1 exosortase/archaeosortase family protein [Alphaproteobacteria bacterium]|tara:strand:- start:923 stop:2461 length:1539 start_codon:yes stop_codon:yes gene_type:complete
MDRNIGIARYPWLFPALYFACFLVATASTLSGLVDRWLKFDESYSHGFLVLVISIFLTVSAWRRHRPVVGFYWFWLLPLCVSGLVYLAGSVLLIEAFQQVALLPLLIGGLLVLWGWRQTQAFFIPMGLMVFTLPFWDYLSWNLQLITVAFNQLMLSQFDIEFIVEGVFVYFPGVGAFEIAHGCSGLRYLLVGATLSLLYGELNYRLWRTRCVLLFTGVVISLVANWIRVFVIIYIGYESEMTSSLIKEHDFFGWWVFAGTLVPLYFFARWLEGTEKNLDSAVDGNTEGSGLHSAAGMLSPLFLVLLMGAASWSVSPSLADMNGETEQHSVSLVDASNWMPLFRRSLLGWQPAIVRPDRILEQTYIKRGTAREGQAGVRLLVALYSYDYQRPKFEVVQYNNRIYDSSVLVPKRTFSVDPVSGQTPLAGLELGFRQTDTTFVVAYGYYVEGRWENNELQAKLAQLPGMFNSRSDASLLVIGVHCEECDRDRVLRDISPLIKEAAQEHLDRLYTN